jgi:hypothetical protein
MSRPLDTVRNCGSCKWLTGGVDPKHRKKDGTMKERYRFTVFECSVPFNVPKVPACMERNFSAGRRSMMAPYYGENCSFWEPLK